VNKNKQIPELILGAHFSIAGGIEKAVDRAKAYGCNAFQIFTKNSNTWKEKRISEAAASAFSKAMKKNKIAYAASHCSYLINLAGPEPGKRARSVSAVKNELLRADILGLSDVVLHPGAHMGSGESAGIERIAANINRIFSQTPESSPRILLETTAGQGSSLGHEFWQIRAIIDKIEDKKRIGVCLDTCHVFAAGYDLRTAENCEAMLKRFDAEIGLSRLFLIHLNDSKKECGSRIDRHEHIGEGKIGINGFKYMMTNPKLSSVPKIIETPKKKNGLDGDKINLALLRSLAGH